MKPKLSNTAVGASAGASRNLVTRVSVRLKHPVRSAGSTDSTSSSLMGDLSHNLRFEERLKGQRGGNSTNTVSQPLCHMTSC